MTAEPLPPAISEAALPQAPAGRRPPRPRHPLLDTGRPLGRVVRLGMVAVGLTVAFASKIPLCPFAIVTRHPCPGCGLTRATFAALRGDFHEAVHFHPLVFLVTPLITVMFTYNAIQYVRRGQWFASEKLKGPWVDAGWILLGVTMIALWIARFFGAFGGPVPV